MTDVLHITWQEMYKKEVTDYDGVVLIDFYADRCGPCRMLGPIMEELVEDNQGKNVKIIKVDVDAAGNQEIAGKFGVSSIPAVFLINAWEIKEGIIWVNPKENYQQKIDELLTN